GFMMPRQSCGCSNANESKTVGSLLDSAGKSATDDEAILQLIRLLTKNLTDDSLSSPTKSYGQPEEVTFGIGTPPAEVVAAREAAKKAVGDAKNANYRARTAAEEAANARKAAADAAAEEAKARDALIHGGSTADYLAKSAAEDAAKEKSEAKLRDAAAAETRAKSLMTTATEAVKAADAEAAKAVDADKPAFEYKVEQLPGPALDAQRVTDDHFTSNYVTDSAKNSRLGKALGYSMESLRSYYSGPLSTNVDRASQIIKDLRDTGASFTDIYKFFGSTYAKSLPDPIKKIALLAIEGYADTRVR
ncbi:MAG: hypothetical protein NT128_02500, partial [Proteobacteria bacterium]|nr:hypothetical protein [Pseudomonadota bacterium]